MAPRAPRRSTSASGASCRQGIREGLRAGPAWDILPPMEWTTPTWAEIKMDAEIGSYQEDFEPTRDPIVESDESAARPPSD